MHAKNYNPLSKTAGQLLIEVFLCEVRSDLCHKRFKVLALLESRYIRYKSLTLVFNIPMFFVLGYGEISQIMRVFNFSGLQLLLFFAKFG